MPLASRGRIDPRIRARNELKRQTRSTTAAIGALLFASGLAIAGDGPPSPAYFVTFEDAVTGDNVFVGPDGHRRWPVDVGSDVYQVDVYERPTAQTYSPANQQFAAREYWENLDIVRAKMGFDGTWLFVAIDMFGLDRSDSGGDTLERLRYDYGFRIALDGDGRFGHLFVSETPFDANPSPTNWGPLKTFGYRDTDGDVGGAAQVGPTGLDVTKSDNPEEEHGLDGYDLAIISDGKVGGSGPAVLFARLDPADPTIVEFALRYASVGLTLQDLSNLAYFDCEANKGLQDPQNHHWNDKYTRNEAGSPNPGAGGLSEFGTQGLGNIYELDTLRADPLPRGITTYCVGDGPGNGGGSCPCGNDVPAGSLSGCDNGTGTGGTLTAAGVPSVSNDTLVLTASIPPNAPGFFFQGTQATAGGNGTAFGNGLRCVSGTIVRLQKIPGGAGTTLPLAGDPPISVQFGIPAGVVRYYQVWYRNAGGPCGATFNMTNGVRIVWLP